MEMSNGMQSRGVVSAGTRSEVLQSWIESERRSLTWLRIKVKDAQGYEQTLLQDELNYRTARLRDREEELKCPTDIG